MTASKELGQVHHLELQVDRARDGRVPDALIVRILVDGEEAFARTAARAYMGFDPAEILDPDVAPLLPAEPARRIAVYRCCCGEPGCGCVAPLIREHGGHVAWSDFRDYTGVYDEPAAEANPGGGIRLPFPDAAFDAVRYRAEVERATADRWWESPQLKTARLLRGHLDQQASYLTGLGWKRDKLWPTRVEGTFRVTLHDSDDHQILIDLTARPGAPEDQAREMAGLLLAIPPERWHVTACSFCDGWFQPSLGCSQADHDEELARHPRHAPSARRP